MSNHGDIVMPSFASDFASGLSDETAATTFEQLCEYTNGLESDLRTERARSANLALVQDAIMRGIARYTKEVSPIAWSLRIEDAIESVFGIAIHQSKLAKLERAAKEEARRVAVELRDIREAQGYGSETLAWEPKPCLGCDGHTVGGPELDACPRCKGTGVEPTESKLGST